MRSPIDNTKIVVAQSVSKKIAPVTETIINPDDYNVQTAFPVPPGHYHLVKVDLNGVEILGSDVAVSKRTYDRTFSKLPEYKVKKNPTK